MFPPVVTIKLLKGGIDLSSFTTSLFPEEELSCALQDGTAMRLNRIMGNEINFIMLIFFIGLQGTDLSSFLL